MNATTIRVLNRRQGQLQQCHLPNAPSEEIDQWDARHRLCQSVLWIQTNRDGVLWRGLHPLLFDAPLQVTRQAVQILLRQFRTFIRSGPLIVKNDGDDNNDDHDVAPILKTFRQVPMPTKNKSIDIWITPPEVTRIHYTFSGLLIHYEHLWLTLQSLSAWIATLGGGYFLCRHLATAVRMARQQRALALWMCDYDTADRCTLNEAFNYIHSGQFRVARRLIRAVQQSSTQRNDTLTLRMVHSATLFLHRVKQAAKFAREKDDTIDDYQRIRIVGDRSQRVMQSCVPVN
jgi:hypothetical protein